MGKKKKRKKSGKKSSEKYGRWDSSLRQRITKVFYRRKKMSKKMQQKSVHLLAELLNNGFTFQKSLHFMAIIYPKEKVFYQAINHAFEEGEPIYVGFRQQKFSEKYIAQINLADKHGDLVSTFRRIAKQMADYEKQREGLSKVLAYPLILLVFLSGMIGGMKWFLLPQMDGMVSHKNLSILVIERGPAFFLFLLVAMFFSSTLIYLFFLRKSYLSRVNFLMYIPIVRVFFQYYYTSFFSYEWGKLLSQGIELRMVLKLMTDKGNTAFMQEIGKVLQMQMLEGKQIAQQIHSWDFFLEGFAAIILQGEAKGTLGDELMIYGTQLWTELFAKIEKATQWLQPLIFLLIGVLIIGIYGALLLPIYQNMEGIL